MPFGPKVQPGDLYRSPLNFPPLTPQGVRGEAPKLKFPPSISAPGGVVGGRFFFCRVVPFVHYPAPLANFHFSPHGGRQTPDPMTTPKIPKIGG